MINGADPVPGSAEAPRAVARSAGRPLGGVKLRDVVDVSVEPVDVVVVVEDVVWSGRVVVVGVRPPGAAGVGAALPACTPTGAEAGGPGPEGPPSAGGAVVDVVVVVVVVGLPPEQIEVKTAAVRGRGSLGRPVPGFWNRHPSTSPFVTVANAPVDE